jgi:hypothetical protein
MLATTVCIATVAAAIGALSHPAALRIDGQRVITDVPPVIPAKGEAFVPLRAIADTLGADTSYDAKTGTIELIRGNDTLRMRAGDRIATLNGQRMLLKQVPFAVRGRTMVGLSLVAEAFGTKVRYDKARAKIDVTSPGLVEAGAQADDSQ